MILHTLSASPSSIAFADCLSMIDDSDALLLLGDGVYAALAGSAARALVDHSNAPVFALAKDLMAAGIVDQCPGVTSIDMRGFVELTERYSRQLAWY
tara:strand:- start:16758 stop:17048 length:291 start_codon:yes stop_codon:yes gene_type:complete